MKLTKRLISTVILCSVISQIATAAQVQLDKIEAVVNKELILNSDLVNLKRDIVKRYQDNNQPIPANFDKQILDKLINDKLQLQVADSIGLRINDVQLNQTIENIAKKKNKTITQMRRELEDSGINYNAYVDNIRDELTINEVRQIEVRKRINLSDQEVEQMVKQINQQGEQKTEFRFAHIMLNVLSTDSPKKKLAVDQEAKQLIKKINNGANIKNLAITSSQGPKAKEGGDWGWRKLDAMPSLFAAEISDDNQKGDVIGPFRSGRGVHIIQILDKRGNQSVMNEEVSARHILIKPSVILSDEKAKQLLVSLRKDILAGKKSFAEVAKQYSQDPGSAVKGGELGWADPKVYVPEFRDAALSQSIGELSQPFRTTHGWHILEVLKKRKSDVTEQVTKQKAYGILFNQRFPSEAAAWINEIRQQAYIKINNPDYIIEEE